MTSTLITLAAIIKFVTALREFFKRLFGIKSESEEKLHIYYERRNKTPVGQPETFVKKRKNSRLLQGDKRCGSQDASPRPVNRRMRKLPSEKPQAK
jgi:hypothetical protein